jgi:hypothetical protein
MLSLKSETASSIYGVFSFLPRVHDVGLPRSMRRIYDNMLLSKVVAFALSYAGAVDFSFWVGCAQPLYFALFL